jgi:hypothetical protein
MSYAGSRIERGQRGTSFEATGAGFRCVLDILSSVITIVISPVLPGSRPPGSRGGEPVLMSHLALLGDSTFDNAAYVGAGPALVDQVRERLPAGWRVTLLAVDGSLIADVLEQLAALADDVSHLVVSVGGNDLLAELSVLGTRVGTVGEGLGRLATIRDRFERDYERMLQAIDAVGRPAALCTIYNPRFTDAVLQREASTALALFDDAIVRAARRARLPVLDLRAVCTAEDDYATPIEPSAAGGAKMAGAISELLLQHDFTRKTTSLWP